MWVSHAQALLHIPKSNRKSTEDCYPYTSPSQNLSQVAKFKINKQTIKNTLKTNKTKKPKQTKNNQINKSIKVTWGFKNIISSAPWLTQEKRTDYLLIYSKGLERTKLVFHFIEVMWHLIQHFLHNEIFHLQSNPSVQVCTCAVQQLHYVLTEVPAFRSLMYLSHSDYVHNSIAAHE